VAEYPRIVPSLAQKDVTQATIVRKLSSYARQNQTKKALWELDNIRRTIHILDFIDDPVLRQSLQKALNRGEAYHRMRAGHFLREFGQVPREDRSGAADLVRIAQTTGEYFRRGQRDCVEAQHRLHKRYMRLAAAGKDKRKITTAVARELLGFIWAIGTRAETTVRQRIAA
jgi:hypothetical protein